MQREGSAPSAALLLEHLVSGQHPELAAAACRSAELDAAATELASGSGWLDGREAVAPRLLTLLLAGDGCASLLSEAAQAALLGQLLRHLQAAAVAAHASGANTEEAAPAAAPAMQVLEGVLLSLALGASGPGGEVQALRLALLAASLGLLLHDAAADAEAAAEAAAYGGREPSMFLDESDAESEEPPQQLGVAAAAARHLWQQRDAIAALLRSAPPEQQAALVESLLLAVTGVLPPHASLAAAAAAAEVAVQLMLPALGSGAVQQQLFQALVQRRLAPEDALAASGSSSGACGMYSTPFAAFLAAVGAAAGFEALLPSSSPSESAEAAVGILEAMQAPVAAAATEQQRQQQQQLLQHVAAAAAPALLQPVLAAAAADSASPGHGDVLCLLLRQAVGAGNAAGRSAVASWFAAACGSSEQQPASLPVPLLRRVLPIVGPALRSSSELLQQSGLAGVSQRLCQQSAAAEPAALAQGEAQQEAVQLLLAAVSCFPCTTGADAAAQLPSPAAATAAGQQQQETAAGSSSFSKGDAVWYRRQDGSWEEAEVASVDVSVQPPSYSIHFPAVPDSAHRETEASRLCPRQPGMPPPPSAAQQASAAAAAAAAAAERRAAAGAAMAPVGSCTEEEQVALLQLLQHQARGMRAAAAAARAEGSAAPDPAPEVAAAMASLMHSAVAYCGPSLSQQHWSQLLEQLRGAFALCSDALSAAAGRVAAAVALAAGEIAVGADMSAAAVALQFFRRLSLKGVLQRSDKVRAAVFWCSLVSTHCRRAKRLCCMCCHAGRCTRKPAKGLLRAALAGASRGCSRGCHPGGRAGSPRRPAAAAAPARPASLHARGGHRGRQPDGAGQ